MGVPNVVGYTQDGTCWPLRPRRRAVPLGFGNLQPRAVLRGEGDPAGRQGHGGVITCVAPLLTDKLLTGSVNKTVRVWDLKTPQGRGCGLQLQPRGQLHGRFARRPHLGRGHGQVPQQV